MGQGQQVAARFVLVALKPLPKIAGVRAALRGVGGVGLRLERPVGAVAIDHHPVQVSGLDQGGPFEADERGVAPGLVVLLGRVDDPFPGGAVGCGSRKVVTGDAFGEATGREQADDVHGGRGSFAAPHQVVPLASLLFR